MKKRKKQEPIVLNKTELMPTTLGSIETKESGPIFVIILIILFGVCIYFLPDIISYFNPNETVTITPPIVTPPKEEEPTEPVEEEIKYYPFQNTLSVKIEGFLFSDFVINNTSKVLNYTLKNESAASNYFQKHKYYIELYSSENKLLQRIKILDEELINFVNVETNISEALTNGTISKIAIREIKEEDYPNISIKTSSDNEGYLTCLKDTKKLVYYFKIENSNYLLSRIEEENVFKNNLSDYENILKEYTTLSSTLQNTSGVITDLVPTANGFSFNATLDLSTVSNSTMAKYFPDFYYYEKNELAKVVDFELKSSGYSCS